MAAAHAGPERPGRAARCGHEGALRPRSVQGVWDGSPVLPLRAHTRGAASRGRGGSTARSCAATAPRPRGTRSRRARTQPACQPRASRHPRAWAPAEGLKIAARLLFRGPMHGAPPPRRGAGISRSPRTCSPRLCLGPRGPIHSPPPFSPAVPEGARASCTRILLPAPAPVWRRHGDGGGAASPPHQPLRPPRGAPPAGRWVLPRPRLMTGREAVESI
ncbi:uncharacterized protein LOC108589582 isoform X1 [Callithrix jacchus]